MKTINPKNHPFFTIVIPTLNEEKFLPDLLQDLTDQIYSNFRVIIVDGRSLDQTVNLALGFQNTLPKLTILTSKLQNVSHQRNLGGNKAVSEYILFLDADTRIHPTFLDKLHAKLLRQPADIFTSYCLPDTRKAQDKTIANLINILLETAKVLNIPGAFGAFIGCKTTVFQNSKQFDEATTFAEDHKFVTDLYRQGSTYQLYKLPKYHYSFRRTRKDGYLKHISQVINLKILTTINPNNPQPRDKYPMGGHLFTPDKKSKLEKNIQRVRSSISARKKSAP